MKIQHLPRLSSPTSHFKCHIRSFICVPFSFNSFTILLPSFIFHHLAEMPLSTILEHEPISFNEMAVQENTQAAPLPGCALESKTRHTFSLKASALMATLPSPINPTSRPMTPDSLFGEISNPQNVACPVPDGPIPPIFLRCRTCWRKDHRKSITPILVIPSYRQKDTNKSSNWEREMRIPTATDLLEGRIRGRAV